MKKMPIIKAVALVALASGSVNLYAKKLHNTKVGLVNQGLAGWPPYIEALKDAKKDLTGLKKSFAHIDANKLDTPEVKKYFAEASEIAKTKPDSLSNYLYTTAKTKLIERIKEFMEYLHKFGFVMHPILTESLGKSESFLHKFFNADEHKFHTFFEDNITSFDVVKSSCEEMNTLIADILDSLHVDTFRAYMQWLKDGKPDPKWNHSDSIIHHKE